MDCGVCKKPFDRKSTIFIDNFPKIAQSMNFCSIECLEQFLQDIKHCDCVTETMPKKLYPCARFECKNQVEQDLKFSDFIEKRKKCRSHQYATVPQICGDSPNQLCNECIMQGYIIAPGLFPRVIKM